MRENLFARYFMIEELSTSDGEKAQLKWIIKLRRAIIVVQYLCLIPGWVLGFVDASNIGSYIAVFSSLLLTELLFFTPC